jgi:hypothetical protein
MIDNIKIKSLIIIITTLLFSCQKQKEEGTYPCMDGNCDATFEIP